MAELGLAWLERNFAKYNKDMQILPKRPPGSADYYSANGEPHILILDGHGSHLTWEFSAFVLNGIFTLYAAPLTLYTSCNHW